MWRNVNIYLGVKWSSEWYFVGFTRVKLQVIWWKEVILKHISISSVNDLLYLCQIFQNWKLFRQSQSELCQWIQEERARSKYTKKNVMLNIANTLKITLLVLLYWTNKTQQPENDSLSLKWINGFLEEKITEKLCIKTDISV